MHKKKTRKPCKINGFRFARIKKFDNMLKVLHKL